MTRWRSEVPIASLVVFDGWLQPLFVTALFILLELIVNLILEPWLYASGPSPPLVLRNTATSIGAARLGSRSICAISCSGLSREPSMRTR